MRDHQPITIDKFNGLWDRGDIEEVPLDHFSECDNIDYIASNSFGLRGGIERHQTITVPLGNILRMYNYPTQDKNTLLVLIEGGSIYHVVDSTTMYGPILTIVDMQDFGFAPYAGRAYITPFKSTLVGDLNRELGLQNDYLYVYKGDGTAARKAGGTAPTTNITAANGIAGHTDAGVHIFGYVYETDTGYLTPPGGLVAFTTAAAFSVSFSTVANSGDTFVAKKHIVASKAIDPTEYNGDVNGYDLFFIPDAIIPNNTGTTLSNISFFDADLLEDASHLSDNFALIKAGVGIGVYHNRLCLWGQYDDISLVRVSFEGEPEAFSQIDGLCLVPPDGNPLTNAAELRDILYVMKRNKTVAFADNGDVPSSWSMSVVDNAMGCGVHGIATVLDSGASNIDFLIVASYKGITLFNGRYITPELSWKIQNFWIAQDFKTKNRYIQMINDSVNQKLYCVTTDNRILYGNYANGMDPKSMRWSPWTFQVKVNTLAIINVSEILIGVNV
jgi:hypothetical protein